MKNILRSVTAIGCLSFGLVLGQGTELHAGDEIKSKRAEEKQRQIQRNFMQLIRNIEKTSAAVKTAEPETAKRLEDALSELKSLKIPSQMDEVIKYIQSDGKYQLSERMKKLIVSLETILDFLTLGTDELEAKAIAKLLEDLKGMKVEQTKINDEKANGEDVADQQKALREALKNANAELGKISDENPMKEAIEAAQKDLEDAEKAMKKNEKAAEKKEGKPGDQKSKPKDGEPQDGEPQDGEPQDGEPQDGEQKPGDKKQGEKKEKKDGEEAEKKMKEAIEKIEKAKKEMEEADKDDDESAEAMLEAIREELRRMIKVQQDVQIVINSVIQNPASKRVVKKKLAKQMPVLEKQKLDMQKLQVGFQEGGSITFEMALGMIIEDENSLMSYVAQTVVNDVTALKGRTVIEGLEDMLGALKDLEPVEGGQSGGGGQGQGQGQQEEDLPGIAQIVLAHLMQSRNLKNTKAAQKIEGKSKDAIIKSLETQQKKIDKVIGKAMEAIKDGGDKVK